MSWLNNDGLLVEFGQEPGRSGTSQGVVGEYMDVTDGLHVVEATLTLPNLLLVFGISSIISDTVTIPAGARIESVTTIVQTAADSAGDTATLNMGLIRQDRSTAYDADGLIAAAAQTTIDLAGETNTYTTAAGAGGAFIGTTLANTGLLLAYAATEVFTAGVVVVRIKYRMPHVAQ